MAFANRFHFCFNSVHGVEYNIYILKDGYSGDCDHRRIGRAPILRKQKNGPICGTSLDLYAECAPGHDGEFAELYTSDPKKFRVDVYRAGSLVWTGFVSTELYSEPSIAPPYDVQITATDGLGELKQIDFVPAGLVTLSEHIRTALSYTGANKTIYVASSLIMQGESVVDTFGMSINLDYLNGKNYYDVLTSLLNTLHATITLYGDCWLITRETDLENLLSGGSLSVVSIAPNGSRSTATLSGVVKSVGAMGSADLWPNGNLSTAIEPARKEVVVEAPWHNVPVGIEMQNWETEGDVYGNYTLGRTGETGVIKKEITVDRLDCDIDIILNLGALRDQARPYGVHEGIIRVYLEYENSHLSDPIEGTASGWGAREPQYTEYNISNLTPKDFTFSFPSGGFDDPGTLRIVVQGISVNVNACSIKICPDNAGYRDTIKIDNGARGKDNAVEVTGSRALEDNIIKKEFYVGIWLYSGDIVLKFADSRFSNGDFLSITALSYATSAALARIKTEGHLDVASSISKLPLLITFQGETQWIDTYEWDLKAEDASIVALSLPSNTLDVEAETVTPLPEGYSSSSSGGGSSSGSSSAPSAVPQQKTYFEEDGDGNVKLKDEYGGLWAAGFITSGGVGSSGGGGGSVDLDRVWASLTNNTDKPDVKINTAHLPTLGDGLAYTQSGSGEAILTGLGIASGYKLPTTEEWNSISGSVEALQSLQSQIDSVASRDNFDELTATALFADVIAASDIYGALHGNADTATSAGSAASATNASYLVNSSYGQGSASLPVYFSGGLPVACTASSLFSGLSSSGSTNLSITVAGQTRTAALYATYDASGNTITSYYAKATDLTSVSGRVSAIEARQNWDDIFGIDNDGNVYVKKDSNDNARGFYTYGFMTSGGVGSSGGGGGGSVDLDRVWASLTNNTDKPDVKINTAHLPTAGTGLAYTQSGSGESLITGIGIASGYKLPSTSEWSGIDSNFTTVGTALKSLQSQIDSVAARDNFEELTASAIFADVLAASEGYFGALYGPLHGNADTATSATSAGSAGTATNASYLVSSSYSKGSASLPVYFSGGLPVACTASSIFSSLSSTAATNLSVTVAGQNRTATLYATYDTSSENIATNFSTVGTALKSLQSQIDSVATRNGFDELTATTVFVDTLAATNIYGALHGNADTATYATSASYTTYDSASENIASNFTTVGTALKSLQAQIDSVAMNRAFDELTVTAGYFDMLSVGANLNVFGEIYSVTGIYSKGYMTSGATGSSSDARLKDEIKTVEAKRAAEVIMALRPCEWVWNAKNSCLEGRRSAGLIAQEVQDILPDMVYEINGEYSLLYNIMHGYQISMLQDHETRIEELEKEVIALREENEKLKSRINA